MTQAGEATAGHTPGEWYIAYDDHNGQAVVSGEHTEICTCWHHSVGSIEKQMRANARLIAAAPELFSVMLDLFENEQFQVGIGGNPNRVDDLIARARAAITKARPACD